MVVDQFPTHELVQPAHQSVLEGGGPVASAMVTLARLGARSAMIDRLGDDWRGRAILEEFAREGVATEHLQIAPERSSSIASVLVRKDDGARTIVYSPGDAGEVVPSQLSESLISSSKILHLNGRHLDACVALAKRAKAHDVLVSFDGGAHRFRPELNELIALTDVCIVARQFAFAFSGQHEVDAAAVALLDAGPQIVVITAGTEGSWVFDKAGESFHQPAFAVDRVVDTTGAGDAYHGAFLFGIVRDYTFRSCALLASAVAALSTKKLGGRSALPSFDQTVEFLSLKGFSLEKSLR